jgi:isoleucyl-tRNA synthetase
MTTFDFKRISRHAARLHANIELSAFYFDVRKDALYCDAPSSLRRRAALQVIRTIFRPASSPGSRRCCPSRWKKHGLTAKSGRDSRCISNSFRKFPSEWRDDALAAKWKKIRTVRRVVTGALEIERRDKRIGSSLEAAPFVHITDPALVEAVSDMQFRRSLHHFGRSDQDRVPDLTRPSGLRM